MVKELVKNDFTLSLEILLKHAKGLVATLPEVKQGKNI
jgi:hypothetical protein